MKDKQVSGKNAVAGGYFSAMIDGDGDVWVWGFLGKKIVATAPKRFRFASNPLISERVVKLSAGGYHLMALTESGKVYAWGRGAQGVIGNYRKHDEPEPVFLQVLENVEIVDIVGSHSHSAALSVEGDLYIWGDRTQGKLGRGIEPGHIKVPKKLVIRNPSGDPSDGASGEICQIEQVCLGGSHTLVLATDGTVLVFGAGNFGQLGLGEETVLTGVPLVIEELGNKNIVAISCGGDHSIAVSNTGDVYTWGWNDNGQLGLGDRNIRWTPTIAPEFVRNDSKIVKISGGGYAHTLVLYEDGQIFGCGWAENGILPGYIEDQLIPKPLFIATSPPFPFISISAWGYKHSVAVNSNGQLYSWGDNTFLQLGSPDYWEEEKNLSFEFDADDSFLFQQQKNVLEQQHQQQQKFLEENMIHSTKYGLTFDASSLKQKSSMKFSFSIDDNINDFQSTIGFQTTHKIDFSDDDSLCCLGFLKFFFSPSADNLDIVFSQENGTENCFGARLYNEKGEFLESILIDDKYHFDFDDQENENEKEESKNVWVVIASSAVFTYPSYIEDLGIGGCLGKMSGITSSLCIINQIGTNDENEDADYAALVVRLDWKHIKSEFLRLTLKNNREKNAADQSPKKFARMGSIEKDLKEKYYSV